MGLLNLFRKSDVIVGTKVLVCAVGEQFAAFLKEDSDTYKDFYPATTVATFLDVDGLIGAVTGGYDIVHLLCAVTSSGTIGDSVLTGTELVDRCCRSGVKLLWIGSSNAPEGYIKGFSVRGNRINLVMTINRNEAVFSIFLSKLLSKMSGGETMPLAWVRLCPQVPGASHPDAPDAIFAANRGSIKLKR